MRNHLFGLLLISGLAGCTSDWDTDRNQTAQAPAGAAMVPAQPLVETSRSATSNFASLPDRGELMHYAKDRAARKAGAYTFHPVSISEAHALNAISKGELEVPLPNGQSLQIQYESHEEQADGNWSWIGRNEDGSSAVLTFGDKAVFGHIDHGNAHYRVRTDRAGAWIVETDPLLAAGMSRTQRESRADYLVPPSGGGPLAAAARSQKAASVDAASPEKSMAVVDVLLGYSNGLATRIGSQSGATTYLVSLIAATNNAYANSGVNMRVRLVHAMQVNYADTSSNKDALQGMTGYNADTQQQIPVVAAFNDLRAARETYGADLVALVRNYQEPQQNGCGIAWLLGMGQTEITVAADAPFGYAVVSDGSDRDEGDGNTYFCSTYALAHELGHLMGQAHNTQDSDGNAGRHPYSYGYRESTSSGFFTIMAYPLDDTQARDGEAPHFANPAVNFAGRPTGVANQSDNARSMNITMPIIANFRQTVVPSPYTRNDVNGNGFGDFLWFNAGTRQFSYWLMSGSNRVGSATFDGITAGYTTGGTGDFNADGRADVLWVNTTQRRVYLWTGNANGRFTSTLIDDYPAGWVIAGTGDSNADGKSDIYWINTATRQFAYWQMDGARRIGSRTISNLTAGYTVGGLGDFNNDGRTDVLWINPTLRTLYVGLANAAGTYGSTSLGTYPAGWEIKGIADMNGDGRDDIVWLNTSSRQFSIWYMNGSARGSTITHNNMTAGFTIAALADYNGDGRHGVLWANPTTRQLYVWVMNANGSYSSHFAGTYPAGWQIVP